MLGLCSNAMTNFVLKTSIFLATTLELGSKCSVVEIKEGEALTPGEYSYVSTCLPQKVNTLIILFLKGLYREIFHL
jgi:hypothetical protein